MTQQQNGEWDHAFVARSLIEPTRRGLPTRSCVVCEFMIGLEKTKAKAGEISQSACALSLEDMHRLYDHLVRNTQLSFGERRVGIICYVCIFLCIMSIDQVSNLRLHICSHGCYVPCTKRHCREHY